MLLGGLCLLASLHLMDIGLKFSDVEMSWKGLCSGKGCSGKEVELGVEEGSVNSTKNQSIPQL